MKVPPLSKDDLTTIEYDSKNNPVVRYLKLKEEHQFNIGDVLVRQYARYTGDGTDNVHWDTEMVSRASKVPKKFLYVYENEQGVGYVKQLRSNGSGVGTGITCLANTAYNARYVVDPDYQDHIIIGEGEFDYKAAFKEARARRQEILKENKKILEKTNTYRAVNAALAQLKVGDEFWYGRTIDKAVALKYTVTSAKKLATSTSSYYDRDNLTGEKYTIGAVDVRGNKFILDSNSFFDYFLFLKKPRPFEDPL